MFILCWSAAKNRHWHLFHFSKNVMDCIDINVMGIESILEETMWISRKLPRILNLWKGVIAYVQCNSVAARLCVHPSGYPWGTGNAFFNAWQMTGRLISSFSGRERVRLLHSKLPVNPEWIVGEGGYILPRSYIKVGFVEGLFRSPSRYQFFLDNSSKAKNSRAHIAPSFSDQLILTASLNLCRSLFRSNRIEDLSPSQTTELVIQLRRRFSSDAAQISRVTGISYAETVRSLESF